jgi:hypothetical protein
MAGLANPAPAIAAAPPMNPRRPIVPANAGFNLVVCMCLSF